MSFLHIILWDLHLFENLCGKLFGEIFGTYVYILAMAVYVPRWAPIVMSTFLLCDTVLFYEIKKCLQF